MDSIFQIFDWDLPLLMLYIVRISSFMLPVSAIMIISKGASSMLRERYEPEVWAYLYLPSGVKVPLRHWECTVGRAKSCDVVVDDPAVAPNHLVLIRDEKGKWMVYDIRYRRNQRGKGSIAPEEGMEISDGDVLDLSGCELRFFNLNEEDRAIIAEKRTAPGKSIPPSAMFGYVSIFQLILMFQHTYFAAAEHRMSIALSFVAIFIIMWLYFIIMRMMGRRGLEVEALAFFLSTIGVSVSASATPHNMLWQLSLLLMAIAAFLILGWWLRDLKRVKKTRLIAAIAAGALLAFNLAFGIEQFGSRRWVMIGDFSFQPSEFVKIAYIFAGAATMDRLYRARNLLLYIVFSAACVVVVALLGDFGTALIFFATFLVISFLRSGNIATVVLAISSAALAGTLALNIRPHIAQRFATWGNIWEDVYGAGFQQTRALSAIASGGFFGAGAGNGWFHNIFAADNDLVFAMVSEELGLIVALCAIAALILLTAFTVKNAASGRSAFYVIAGCAAVSMMMIQLGLNVFGTLDMLPFTGVTFPFVSLGGSSLISCWAFLAFIKSTDTRKSASFIMKEPSKMRDLNEPKLFYDEQAWEDEYEE